MGATRTRTGIITLLLGTLLLSSCTEHVKEHCSGKDGTTTCTVTFETSDGQWSTQLEGDDWDESARFSGTFTIESGSGTLLIEGADSSQEYPLTPEEPVVVEDLPLALKRDDDDTWIYLKVTSDPQIDGFSAQYEFTPS